MATRILVLATKNENLEARWSQDFFLKVEPCVGVGTVKPDQPVDCVFIAISGHAHQTYQPNLEIPAFLDTISLLSVYGQWQQSVGIVYTACIFLLSFSFSNTVVLLHEGCVCYVAAKNTMGLRDVPVNKPLRYVVRNMSFPLPQSTVL